MTFRVGLTGGIGCGKSTVAELFAGLGAGIVDTDVISHQLTRCGGGAMPLLATTFGAECLTPEGAMNRDWMRARVFSDPAAKRTLEAILHPMIRAQACTEADACTAPYVIMVVPLLFETQSYRDLLDRTLAVDCCESTQLERTMQRSGLTEATVRRIMSQQLPRNVRKSQADDIILNQGKLADLAAQVRHLHQLYLRLSAGSD
jgi:dephospho-CoA kinase